VAASYTAWLGASKGKSENWFGLRAQWRPDLGKTASGMLRGYFGDRREIPGIR
jgi:hypothetical protein